MIFLKLQLAASVVMDARSKKMVCAKVALNPMDIVMNGRNRKIARYINVRNSTRFNFADYVLNFLANGSLKK